MKEPAQASVREAIEAFGRGEIVVVTDDNDRENEGDLIIAAAHATPEKMAFIIRHTCGIVCAPLTVEVARRLALQPMVADNDAIHGTAFTVSVDYRHGTTTGISAEERTATVRALANNNTGRADFVRPGHIFPLIAKDGGVLIRSGHTEAAVDLCKLAGIEPVAAICELVNDDGTVMRGKEVAAFASHHKLRRIAVADLIAYRQAREKLVIRVSEFKVSSELGDYTGYTYVTPFDEVHHYAFVYGKVGDGRDVPTRLHRANVVEDVFGGAKPIRASIERRFKECAGRGVLGVSARRRGRCADDARSARAPHLRSSAASNGARSGSGHKSCGTCRSARSASWSTRPGAPHVGLAGVRHRDRQHRSVGMKPGDRRHRTDVSPRAQERLEREFAVHRLWEAADQTAFLEGVADRVRGVALYAPHGCSTSVIAALPKLEIIACMGIGVDRIDLAAARSRGVCVTNTPDVVTDDTADIAMALMLASERRIAEADRFVRRGEWRQGDHPFGRALRNRKVGIVALGRIGQAIAHRCEAFGMQIAYYGPRRKSDVAYPYFADLVCARRVGRDLVVAAPRRCRNPQPRQPCGNRCARSRRHADQHSARLGGRRDHRVLVEALRLGAVALGRAAGLDVSCR